MEFAILYIVSWVQLLRFADLFHHYAAFLKSADLIE